MALSKPQTKFIKTLKLAFNVKTRQGIIPFEPTKLQADFLKDFYFCNKKVRRRFVLKSRKIGFTMLQCMEDLIYLLLNSRLKTRNFKCFGTMVLN